MSTYQPLARSEIGDSFGHWHTLPTDAPVITRPGFERKVVTVLFVDVKNSMGLSREVELEDWWSVSAGLFSLMCESADHFGGWVGEYAGDGVNAIFEVTGSPDHHALRACLAAVWVRDAIDALAAKFWTAHGLDLSVRIGINSGEVLTGTMGHRHKRFYTASGYAVALAKRIESLAHPHGIYLSEHTARFVTDAFRLKDLGPVALKGADRPVRVFELLGSPDDVRPGR